MSRLRDSWKLFIASQGNVYRRMVDALGVSGEEGRGVPAKSLGEVVSNL